MLYVTPKFKKCEVTIPLVQTLKLLGETKYTTKKYETCQFCTQKRPMKDSLGIIKVVLKKTVPFTFFRITDLKQIFEKI